MALITSHHHTNNPAWCNGAWAFDTLYMECPQGGAGPGSIPGARNSFLLPSYFPCPLPHNCISDSVKCLVLGELQEMLELLHAHCKPIPASLT
jgi:hypothetical protein